MTKIQKSDNRIQYLDGLRGLAAVLIVLHHYAQAFLPGMFSKDVSEIHLGLIEIWAYNTPLKLPLAGSVWLFVFLILSGLVISLRYISRGKSWRWLKRLCLGRYFRLVGPIVTVGIISFLALTMELNYNQEAANLSGSNWWLTKQWQFEPSLVPMLYQSLIQVFVVSLPIEAAYNSSLWVIPFFFLGTFLIAAALILGKGLGKWRWVGYLALVYWTRQNLYAPLIVGLMLGEVAALGKIKPFHKNWIGAGLLALGIYLGTYPTWTWPGLLAESWYGWLPRVVMGNDFYFYHILGATLLILALLTSPWLQRWLSWKGWLKLGKISFSLYVTHILIINTVASFVLVYSQSLGWAYVWSLAAAVVIGLGLTLPLSRLIYEWVEKR